MATKLFKHAFILLLVIATLDILGEVFYLYWSIWWFDTLLHFLSGICVTMGGISVYFYIFKNLTPDTTKIILIGLAWIVFIGVIWEIFELYFGITFLSDGITYIRDTSSDLLMDIIGGLVGSLYASKTLKNNGQ